MLGAIGGRRVMAALVTASVVGPFPALAVEVDGLYEAQAIVTGQGDTERRRGFANGLANVIAKLSGDATTVRTEGVQRLMSRAAEFVDRFEYEDRMKGIPIHDEQGTRERPYYLHMWFNPVAVDKGLQELGIARWGSNRPRVMIWFGIRDSVRTYVLDTETEYGYGQREVLKSVAKRRGVPIALPAPDGHGQTVSYEDIATANVKRLRSASRRYDAQALLYGTLVMDGNGYWTAAWMLERSGAVHRHRLETVTFDVALGAAIERAAKIFSATSVEGAQR